MRITKIKLLDEIVISLIKVYNHRLYWYMRKQVVNNNGFILKYFYLIFLKFMDEYHCAFIWNWNRIWS